VFVVATTIAVGLVAVPAPARAGPPLPLAPLCKQYGFDGNFSLKQSNGAVVKFGTNGPFDAVGQAVATGTGGDGTMRGDIRGGMNGYTNVDFTIIWRGGLSVGHHTGAVADDGFVHGVTTDEVYGNSANWDSTVPLTCVQPVAAPAPAPAPAPVPATAVLSSVVNGPATLQAGLSGTYVITVSNSGGVKAPVELFIIFAGKLEQTGQISAGGGFDCALQPPSAGINAAVRCFQQLEAGAKFDIVVQGRGSAPGAGKLLAKIGNESTSKDVTIT
jgi:hypothetical protein